MFNSFRNTRKSIFTSITRFLYRIFGRDNSVVDNNIKSDTYLQENLRTLGKKKVQDIMIPRVDISAFSDNIEFQEIINESKKRGYSRFPIFKDNLDNIIGFIHIKDLIPYINSDVHFNLKTVMRSTIFISPFMKILDLLYELRNKRCQIAIVVDEFGGVDGLVTLEDVVEEIIGDITDEHDTMQKMLFKEIKPNVVEVDARIDIEDLEKKIGVFATEEEKDELDTVGGLIVSIKGYIPSANEAIEHSSGLKFTVLQADSIRVKKVMIDYANLKSQAE